MSASSDSFTAVTLLGRLASGGSNEQAWREFVDRYGPSVMRWCRNRGCPESDLEDVLQEVLLKLMVSFKNFRYDPKQRFRNWLATISRNAAVDVARARRSRMGMTGDDYVWSRLESQAAQDDLSESLSAAFDMELFDQACSKVKRRVRADHWETFELTRLKLLSPSAAARQLNMALPTFYVNRSRILTEIRDEVMRLKREVDGDGE
jgi:RNA polymerase sigma factor (sigma-70 family)